MGERGLSIARTVPGVYSVLALLAAKRVVVRGRSMTPALLPGDRVLFDRLAYRLDDPRVGDIVLAWHADRPGVAFIKRVAECNGLAPNEFWLLGDNADESTDSRTLGRFSRADIVGRAWVVYWPQDRFRVIERP
jgi:signal peptidase I